MLRHLHIEDYALIDRLDIELHPGLNLLTGETGSGKSIVVDAVGLLLGEKASPETIRAGAERARISGIFSPEAEQVSAKPAKASPRKKAPHNSQPLSGNGRQLAASHWQRISSHLEEAGIEAASADGLAGELIVQRDILAAGRSRIFINSQPASIALLKNLVPLLAEVHGQNEQQTLFEAATQLEALDRFGGLQDQALTVGELFKNWTSLQRETDSLRAKSREWLRQRDLWQFQRREIEQAAITEGEETQLEEEKRLLAHAERIQTRLSSCYDLLYDSPSSAASSLASAQRRLEEIAAFDERLRPLAESLLSAKVSVEDLALAVRDRLSHLDAAPGRLEDVEERLALFDKLKRKYGPTMADVLRYCQQVSSELEQAESSDARLQELERQTATAKKEYVRAAQVLSTKRAKAAQELKRAVEKELQALAMSGTIFEASAHSGSNEAEWRATGMDQVEFLISPNPGEPLRPLARIASGGETSRIMLALETVIASHSSGADIAPALIFDEVDTGIGGRAAEAVGRRLRLLGETRQVLCVTHLPQIASFAHHHFRVEKRQQSGRTVTVVDHMDAPKRKAELARMLSGSQITAAVLDHAEQLLKANAG
jgi:DNA repair protein RecN (Recombination protein N)